MPKNAKSRYIICEDTTTGAITLVCEGPCPVGSVEKLAQKIADKGIGYKVEPTPPPSKKRKP